MTVNVNVQDTPNPNARRFVLDKPVQEDMRGRVHTNPTEETDPLVAALLAVPGVSSVLTLATSVTVSKTPDAEWADVEAAATAALERYFS